MHMKYVLYRWNHHPTTDGQRQSEVGQLEVCIPAADTGKGRTVRYPTTDTGTESKGS